MKRLLFLFLILFLVPIHASSQAFQPGCNLKGQIKILKKSRSIDTTCPIEGKGQAPSKLQNRAKNNFCAASPAVEVTIAKLRTLDSKTQTALTNAGIPFGHPTSIPPDRTLLQQGFTVDSQNFKEGMQVLLRAFVLESHYSNTGSGEAVNCSKPKQLMNDIHITLAQSPHDAQCEGATAEISPHLRPTTWADFVDYEFTNPVMLIGNLMYDASHTPCTAGHPVHPARSSSWEIHPVYSIFVCKNSTLAACPPDFTNSSWVPFDVWVNLFDDEEEGHHAKRTPDPFWALKDLFYTNRFEKSLRTF
jgi:hypothetical protein